MKSSYSIEIEAPVEKVFAWITDSQRLMEWVPNLVEHEELEMTESVIGSTDRHVYLENGRRMEMHGVITEYDKNERVATELRGSGFDLYLDYRLEDLGGRTRLTQHCQVCFRGFYKIMGLFMFLFRKASEKKLAESFDALKQKIEADP